MSPNGAVKPLNGAHSPNGVVGRLNGGARRGAALGTTRMVRHLSPDAMRPTSSATSLSSSSAPLIDARRLRKTFPAANGGFVALDDVDLTIGAGEFTVIVGESGSGKS